MTDAIGIIEREHTALLGVVDCLNQLAKDMAQGGDGVDDDLLDAILEYIENFPDRFHHPKEDEYLFKALYERAPEVRPTLDALKAEHATCGERIAAVRRTLEAFRRDPAAREQFIEAVRDYVDFQYRHMALEESEIMPLARKALNDEDWRRINAAFADNTDPLFDKKASAKYRTLHSRIAGLAPPPIGVGAQDAHAKARAGLYKRLKAMFGGG